MRSPRFATLLARRIISLFAWKRLVSSSAEKRIRRRKLQNRSRLADGLANLLHVLLIGLQWIVSLLRHQAPPDHAGGSAIGLSATGAYGKDLSR
ncbi:hypothetical protein ACVIIV_004584 [Bradyrhizobium sp. USDA 4354]